MMTFHYDLMTTIEMDAIKSLRYLFLMGKSDLIVVVSNRKNESGTHTIYINNPQYYMKTKYLLALFQVTSVS